MGKGQSGEERQGEKRGKEEDQKVKGRGQIYGISGRAFALHGLT